MKHVDVKSSTYINSSKLYVPNWYEEVFAIKKVKSTVPWTYIISDLKGEELARTFYEKELQKSNQKEFRVEKIIKRKGNKLYVKLYVKRKATIVLLTRHSINK